MGRKSLHLQGQEKEEVLKNLRNKLGMQGHSGGMSSGVKKHEGVDTNQIDAQGVKNMVNEAQTGYSTEAPKYEEPRKEYQEIKYEEPKKEYEESKQEPKESKYEEPNSETPIYTEASSETPKYEVPRYKEGTEEQKYEEEPKYEESDGEDDGYEEEAGGQVESEE